jgi:hypothetical protein
LQQALQVANLLPFLSFAFLGEKKKHKQRWLFFWGAKFRSVAQRKQLVVLGQCNYISIPAFFYT